ncbi:DeoR/GlpR family DNA-binding transcription regulator [Cellulomonas fimi]|uniref:Transcriptional regulator, DeoR family n=1 Tax=Cellulomonas fimi (strain ATCC 484 / DSM 20113 / JCM 1341 / CCUG 24087 / LMG 16345 / NBRC 15513 / NCIMB 8980 / NCTC 7547 / NRS-133) TaxID=590998 RepID=F4H366_CELFA|nr:DeoR/GlpR family DNA-binding transcription regulator [Cellulomonas fimi]AEE45287.1 transcriptional regulator, DeoR family [Cellulomonas fimi ATCC 484]VEH28818.1 Glycerol-3-phosphate regulon repressor [Cellulomonas fimi]
MLASQRQEHILGVVRAHGAARVADLVTALDVSDMTVRRDIAELARAGLVRRVHGGAVAPDAGGRPTDEPGFEAKRAWAQREKHAIAQAALASVEPGQAIALSAGTTTHLLAELLAAAPALRPLTVVTNSVGAADVLHHAAPGADRLEVILTGGVRTPSDALVGPVADTALAHLRVDRAYLGVHGLDADGLTTPNLAEAATNRALIACAAATTVVADHSKWGVTGLARIATLDEVDVLLSDDGLPADARTAVAAHGTRVQLVPAPAGAPAAPAPPTPQQPTGGRP